MARQIIDTTTPQPGGKIGDTAKVAFGKVNDNFAELYDAVANIPEDVTGDIEALDTRVTANEGDIEALDTRVTAIDALAAQAAPPGMIAYFAMETPPTGWLRANGALVSRTTYANLFAAIGTRFGAGDGSTTFQLPDLRGEFLRGWDDGRGVDSGRTFGSWQKGSLITGNDNTDAQLHGFEDVGGNRNGLGWDVPNMEHYSCYSSYTSVGVVQSPVLYSEDHYGVTRPRNVAMLACIKF